MEAHEELVGPMMRECKNKSTTDDTAEHRKLLKENIKDKGEQLLKDLMHTMDEYGPDELFVTHAQRSKHKAKCEVTPGRDGALYKDANMLHSPGLSQLEAPLDIMVSGTSCVDWSSMGNCMNLAGRSALPFSVQLQWVRKVKPVVFIHECTRTFDPTILQRYLPDYKVHSSIQRPALQPDSTSGGLVRLVSNPKPHNRSHGAPRRGFPVHRTRKYSACIRNDLTLTAELSDLSLLDRHPAFDGDALFCAPQDIATRLLDSDSICS